MCTHSNPMQPASHQRSPTRIALAPLHAAALLITLVNYEAHSTVTGTGETSPWSGMTVATKVFCKTSLFSLRHHAHALRMDLETRPHKFRRGIKHVYSPKRTSSLQHQLSRHLCPPSMRHCLFRRLPGSATLKTALGQACDSQSDGPQSDGLHVTGCGRTCGPLQPHVHTCVTHPGVTSCNCGHDCSRATGAAKHYSRSPIQPEASRWQLGGSCGKSFGGRGDGGGGGCSGACWRFTLYSWSQRARMGEG